MSMLAPLALGFGLSLPILVLFYLLKVRRTEREVSSVLLWETFRRDLAAHDPWQRLRWSVLLILQLILLAALTLALARPAAVAPAPMRRFSAIVIDTSASMRSTDVTPNRFEQARSAARDLIDQSPDGTTVALIEAGATARVVVPETPDHAALLRGLADLEPTDAPEGGAGDASGATSGVGDSLTAALRIGAALARGRPNATLHLFSDGAYPHLSEWDDLATANGNGGADLTLRFHPIGTSVGNRAITALALRSDGAGSGTATQLFARVENFDTQPSQVPVTLSADGKVVETRQVDLPADGARQLFFSSLPPDAHVIQLKIAQTDPLAAGDVATLVQGAPPAIPVLLVTRGNLFLQKALQSVPGIALYQVTPRSFDSVDLTSYGVLIFDGFTPDRPPAKNALLVNPTDSPWLPTQGTVREPPITVWRSDDPTLAFVDLRTIRISRASNVTLPDWAHPLIESNGIPLGFIGSNNGQRIVGLTFDLQQSNLPLSAAFPILVANVMRYLAPPSIAQTPSLAPGEPAIIRPPPGVDRVVVQAPTGDQTVITPNGPVVRFDPTGHVGLYQATEYAGSQVVGVQPFAVDLFSPSESDLRPRANLTDHDAVASQATAEHTPTIHEFAPWLLALAVPLLLGEWWWFHRK